MGRFAVVFAGWQGGFRGFGFWDCGLVVVPVLCGLGCCRFECVAWVC